MNLQRILKALVLAGLLTGGWAAASEGGSAKTLVYISPGEYTHSVLLRHPYYEYWFSQGPRVEALVKPKFASGFGEVGLCEGNDSATSVIWLKPDMFYNPIARLYYADLVAEVYAGDGKPLGVYRARAKQPGLIDTNTDGRINAAYATAMNDLVKQMAADPNLHQSLDRANAGNSKLSCPMVTLLSPNKTLFERLKETE